MIVILVATAVTSLSLAGQLLVGREILDLLTGDEEASTADLAPYLILLGIVLLASAITQAIANEQRVLLTERLYRNVTNDIVDVATAVEIEAYEGPEFHDRLSRAQSGASGHSSSVVFGIVTMMSTLIVGAGVMVVLVTVTPWLIPLLLLGALPIVLVNVRNNRALYRMEFDLVEVQRERSYLELLLTHRNEAKELRSYDFAPTLRQWHSQLWDERLRRLRVLIRRRLTLNLVASTLNTGFIIGTLAFALVLAVRGSISVGDAAIAIVGVQQLGGRLRATGTAFSGVHQGIVFLRDFESFRALLPKPVAQERAKVPPAHPRRLVVDSVGYRYPGSEIDAVVDVSFELRAGQVLAVVGANGSGKSTLMKLLCGLLEPTRGSISWDGTDLTEFDPKLVRRRIAPVFQDYARPLLRLRDAIALGDTTRMDDLPAIRRAGSQAGLEYLFESLPDGAESRLGKFFTGGTDLSIGEWQRLAIARAFFRDAPIVIMDEPSASLDPRGEADVFNLLQRLGEDRLVVFVSHRFATVTSADLVLVMDHGLVVQIGSHAELMRSGGLYRDLFEIQATRYGIVVDDGVT